MLIQVKNKVLMLEARSYAEIMFPKPGTSATRTTLSLIIDGHKLSIFGDEAAAVWLAVQQNSNCLLRPEPGDPDLPSSGGEF